MAGLTDDGLTIKRYREIQTDVQDRLDEGTTGIVITDESNKTANNIAHSIISSLAELWEQAESVYNSGNIYKATGTSLDKLVAYRSLTRTPARYSSGLVEVSANGRVSVNTTTRLRDIRNRVLVVTENRTLGTTLFKTASVILNTAVTGTRYFLVLGGNEYFYTATGGDDSNAVMTGLKASIDTNSAGTITAVVEDDTLTFTNVAIENLSAQFHPDFTLGNYSSLISARASDFGSLNFPSNTITSFVNNIANVEAVNNLEAFSLGRLEETDRELRQRFLATPSATGRSTVNSIIRAVELVEGITNVNVVNNPFSTTSAQGLPPHSYETIVGGGSDTDIAQAIFDSGPAGIESFGTQTETVLDSRGNPHPIGFTRPSDVYIFFRVRYETYPEETLPSDVDALVKDAIVTSALTLAPDQDIIPSRFIGVVYAAIPQGIGEMVIECGSSTDPTDIAPVGGYSSDRLEVLLRQKAVVESARILVQETTLP